MPIDQIDLWHVHGLPNVMIQACDFTARFAFFNLGQGVVHGESVSLLPGKFGLVVMRNASVFTEHADFSKLQQHGGRRRGDPRISDRHT